MSTTIPCPTCKGTGRAPVARKLQNVLDQLGKSEMTVEQMLEPIRQLEHAKIGLTSVNNRMERLRKMGLLDRRREGRAWVYFAK